MRDEAGPVYVEWRTFTLGERVRITLSPECCFGHWPEEDGQSGTVSGILGERELRELAEDGHDDRSHPYLVDFDAPFWVNLRSMPDRLRLLLDPEEEGQYAAAELEPLEP